MLYKKGEGEERILEASKYGLKKDVKVELFGRGNKFVAVYFWPSGVLETLMPVMMTKPDEKTAFRSVVDVLKNSSEKLKNAKELTELQIKIKEHLDDVL